MGEGILDRPAIADNSVLVNFVDAGQAELLFQIVGGPVYVAPSVVDPSEVPPFETEPRAETNRFLYSHEGDADHLERWCNRLSFVLEKYGEFWQQAELSPELLARALGYKKRFPGLKRRDGDAESLVLAEANGWTLLCDDTALCEAARSLGVVTHRTCGLLLMAVEAGFLTCAEAATLYNTTMIDQNGFYSHIRLDPYDCQCG